MIEQDPLFGLFKSEIRLFCEQNHVITVAAWPVSDRIFKQCQCARHSTPPGKQVANGRRNVCGWSTVDPHLSQTSDLSEFTCFWRFCLT